MGERIHDKALLNRLAHRVDVERAIRSVRMFHSEYLKRLLLWRCGKRAECQVLMSTMHGQGLSELILPVFDLTFSLDLDFGVLPQGLLGISEGCLKLERTGTSLARMGLINNHSETFRCFRPPQRLQGTFVRSIR